MLEAMRKLQEAGIGRARYALYGITYPSFLCRPWILRLWRRFLCRRGWHLWDEVISSEGRSLVCDACELDIEVASIDDSYVSQGLRRQPEAPAGG
jgi:hypothetical protein